MRFKDDPELLHWGAVLRCIPENDCVVLTPDRDVETSTFYIVCWRCSSRSGAMSKDAYLEEFEIRTPTLLGPGIQTEVIFLLSR